MAPRDINDPLMIAFIGSPLADTVRAGDGTRRPIVAMGHSGADSVRTMPDSVRALRRNRPFIFIPDRPLRVSQDAVGPMRIEGEMTIPLLGVFRVRGERISREPPPCQD